jgi:methylthioribulose-1-phosphate dehydratase
MTTDDEFPELLSPYADKIDELRSMGRIFWKRGWSLGTSSNYSFVASREPLQLVVTASGKHKGRLKRGDFVLVDAHGRPAVAGQPKSSAETLLHCVAAENPAVGAVLHTHSVWATVLSDRFAPHGGVLLEGFEMLKGLSGVSSHKHAEWIPIFENTQDIPELAQQVQSQLQNSEAPLRNGYIIRRHGIYTWGSDLQEAFRQIEILEFLLECVGRSAMMA